MMDTIGITAGATTVSRAPTMKRRWAGGFAVLATTVAGWMLHGSLTAPPRHGARPQTAVATTGLTLAALPAGGRERLVVTSLRSGSPAMASGLRVGDTIEQVDGHLVGSVESLDHIMAQDGDRPVAIEARRSSRTVHVTLIESTGETGGEQQDPGGGGRRSDR